MRDRSFGAGKRWGTACLSVFACVLLGLWFWARGRDSTTASLHFRQQEHSVTLKWNASTSIVDGYNVYRRDLPDGQFSKINDDLVRGLTFVDRHVKSGMKYSYVVRAVAKGTESIDSNRVDVVIP